MNSSLLTFQPKFLSRIRFHLTGLIILLIIATGCGKLVQDSNANFIGIWKGTDGIYDYLLQIDKSSNGSYASCYSVFYDGSQGDCDIATGKARIKGDRLSIGTRWFDINTSPFKGPSGQMTCVINSVTYLRN